MMNITYLDNVPLFEEWFASDPNARMKTAFVDFEGTPPADSTLVYMVMDVQGIVGTHTDNVEEVIVVIEGDVEIDVAGNVSQVRNGGIVLVPAGKAHGLRNIGSSRARAIGFFSSPRVVTTFREPLIPQGGSTGTVKEG